MSVGEFTVKLKLRGLNELATDDGNGVFSECIFLNSQSVQKQIVKAISLHCGHCVKWCMVHDHEVLDYLKRHDLDAVYTVHRGNCAWVIGGAVRVDVD